MKSNLETLCRSIVNHTLGLNPDIRQTFFSCLIKFRDGKIHISQLIEVANTLFSGHDHLSQRFQSIVPPPLRSSPPSDIPEDCNNDDDIVEAISRKRKKPATPEDVSDIRRAIDFCKRVRLSFNDDDGVYMSFLDALWSCRDKKDDDRKVAAIEVEKELNILFHDHPELQIELHKFVADFDDIRDEHEGEKVDSIRRGGRRDDEYAYQTPIKHHPCKAMLFEIDDDQSDFEVALSQLESTREKIMNLVVDVKHERRTTPIILEDYRFTALNLRCIEVLYGMTGEDEGYGQDVIEQLRTNPIKTGEIIWHRLYQMEEEMRKVYEKNNKIWAQARKDCHERWKRDKLCSKSLSPESAPEEGKEEHRPEG